MPDIALRGVRLHYQLDGPTGGTPIVLSNSLSSNLNMWDAQVPELTAAGWRVLRYDNRGHGRSEAAPGPYTLDQLVDDMAALLDVAGFERAHFCGLSLGGMVGQRAGTRHAARLVSLTLCDTAAYMGPPEMWAERMAAVEQGGMAALVDGTINRWFTPAGQARLPETVATIRAAILGTSPAGYLGCCAAIRDMDQREAIAGIRLPTHVIVGADDAGTPVSAAEFIHQRIAGSRLTVIPEAAHLANVEQAAAFNAALLGFLEAQR